MRKGRISGRRIGTTRAFLHLGANSFDVIRLDIKNEAAIKYIERHGQTAPVLIFKTEKEKPRPINTCMNKQQLIKKLEKSWEALLESYAGLSDQELAKGGVIGDWSVKDIIAHVTVWEEEALGHLPTILTGGKPPRYSIVYGGIDAFNALMTDRRKNLPLGEVLKQRDETHRRLIDFIQGMTEDELNRQKRFHHRLRLDTYSHYPKHAEAIEKWRKLV